MAKKSSSFFIRTLRWFFKLLLVLFISSFIYVLICKWVMPPVTITQLANAVSGDGLKKDYVNSNDISPYLKLAAIASEDQLFPYHHGFDWKSLEKSLSSNSKKKNKISGAGASTISQQVAKNVFLWQGEGLMRYIRKVPEFYFTQMIEWVWGKQRILEVYLNVIETGRGIYGVEAAAQQYFHKHAKTVSQKEAAMIIACLPNPKLFTVKPLSRWVAWKHQLVLKQMHNIQTDPGVRALIK